MPKQKEASALFGDVPGPEIEKEKEASRYRKKINKREQGRTSNIGIVQWKELSPGAGKDHAEERGSIDSSFKFHAPCFTHRLVAAAYEQASRRAYCPVAIPAGSVPYRPKIRRRITTQGGA